MKKVLSLLFILASFTACSFDYSLDINTGNEPTVLNKEGDAFLALVKEDKLTEAYNATSTDFKATTTEEDFKTFLPSFAPADNKGVKWTAEEFDLKYGYLHGKMTMADDSKVPIKMDFIKEEEKWKLLYIGLDVEKIAKLPLEEDTKKTVHETITAFIEAVEKEDFKDFYLNQAATIWQKQTSPEELKSIFTSFYASKEALKEVKTLKPEITTHELIEEDTILNVKGEYKAKKYVLTFEVQYLNQDGELKLFSINVEAK